MGTEVGMEALVSATAGGMAAVLAGLVVYPLDTVLVRYQAATSKIRGDKSLPTVLAEILKSNGVQRLYQGVQFKMTETFARNFLFFYWYQLGKLLWTKSRGSIGTVANLGLATGAAVINQCVNGPLEMVSTQLQTTEKSIQEVIADILKNDGALGFYRGFGASLILCANPAITNATFDRLKMSVECITDRLSLRKRAVQRSSGSDYGLDDEIEPVDDAGSKPVNVSAFQLFLLGALAKSIATILTYPYIRSKILVQARGARNGSSRSEKEGAAEVEILDDGDPDKESKGGVTGSDAPNDCPSFSVEDPLVEVDASLRCETGKGSAQLCAATLLAAMPSLRMEQNESGLSVWRKRSLRTSTDDTDDCQDAFKRTQENTTSEKLSEGSTTGRPPHRIKSEVSIADSDKGVTETIVATIMNDGIPGLYRGLALQLVKTVLSAAILYTVKEKAHDSTEMIFRGILELLSRSLRSRRETKK